MAYKAFLKGLEQLGVESYQGTFVSSLDMKLQGMGLISNSYLHNSVSVERFLISNVRGKDKDELGPVETMVCGGMAGGCFWSCIFPMDVIKSRIQVKGFTGNVFSSKSQPQIS